MISAFKCFLWQVCLNNYSELSLYNAIPASIIATKGSSYYAKMEKLSDWLLLLDYRSH